MGRALELVTAQATAPSTGTAAAAVAGNSLTIRDSRKPIRMLGLWRTGQAAGSVRVVSPYLHDAVIGMHFQCASGQQVLMRQIDQPLYPQDTLQISLEGSATAGDIEMVSFLAQYDDLPGISGQFITAQELKRRLVDITALEHTISTGTAGGYSGDETIVAEEDSLKGLTEYAILGVTAQVGVHAVRWVSPDWGNLGVGMPVLNAGEGWHDAFYFRELAMDSGLPVIPVFNSANKQLTFISAATNELGVDLVVSTVLGRLK